MNNINISIIIPTYKPQDYLWECLDSIASQTLDKSKYEIIIILNGCIEPYSYEIQDYLIKKMQLFNVQFICTEIAGVSNARNIGLKIANGEFLCFMDDDDLISPTYLEELLMKSSNETVCLSNGISFVDKTNKYINSIHQILFQKFSIKESITIFNVRQYFSAPWMKIIHRDIIGNTLFDVRFKNGEDTLFMFLISDKINNIRFTSSKAVYYRRIRENSATTRKRKWWSKFMNVIRLNYVITISYVKNIRNYNLSFYLTRILGLFKTLLK